uniref:RRM domain-containing protein n=1 Tax=Caenorhabditis japonica TaxID=281687 RepID=A0A8R1DZR6_CAEJA
MSAEYGSYGYYASSGGAASSSAVTTAPPSTDEVTATPYTAIFNIVGPALTNSDISYDTSSKDPHMIRARVFIGNIARAIITRDDIIDLFRPFGKLLAVNYFAQQGFAFVQFNEAAHADQSCLALNATQWKSCCLDVHLAMLGAVSKNIDSIKSGPPVAPIPSSLLAKPTAKTAKVEKPVPPSLKRQPDEEVYASYEQSKRKHANADKTANDELTPNQMCDTMLCGNCRFVSSDFEEFRDHRITGCTKYEESEEPTHRLK